MTQTEPNDEPSDRDHPTESHAVVEFDPKIESVTECLSSEISELTGVPMESLNSLRSVIDPEALDGIVYSAAQRSEHSLAEVTIQYHGYTVTIQSYGVIEIA